MLSTVQPKDTVADGKVKVLDTLHCGPDDGAGWKVRESPKLL